MRRRRSAIRRSGWRSRPCTIHAGRTSAIIVHRLSTVEIADRVLVMERGLIVVDAPGPTRSPKDGRFSDLHQAWIDSLA